MPLTSKGEKVMGAMKEQYGAEKGKEVFYASKNKGTLTGVDQTPPSNVSTGVVGSVPAPALAAGPKGDNIPTQVRHLPSGSCPPTPEAAPVAHVMATPPVVDHRKMINVAKDVSLKDIQSQADALWATHGRRRK